MDSKFKLIIDSFGKERFKFDEPLKDYVSLGFGGGAKLFFIAFSQDELIKIINMCRDLDTPFFIFGTGSKMMISERGFPGLVIKNRTKNITILSVKGKATRIGVGIDQALVEVESGVSLNKFCEFLKSQNLVYEEFENIPGSIGGNLFISKLLQMRAKSIKVLTLEQDILEIEPAELRLNRHIILSAVFRIKAKSLL